MTGPLDLGPGALLGAASLLALHAGLSLWLRLGLERQLLVAAARATVQLALLAVVLVPVFETTHPALVLGLCLLMIALAGREAAQRVARTAPRLAWWSAGALLLSGGLTSLLATAVLVQVEPWWSPRYLIPLLGMVLGNALTGVSLGLDTALLGLSEGRARVEATLAAGGTAWEAARPVVARSVRAGLIPILNTMSAVGLVTIPGMMTGQILGGTPPGLAARYQLLILFLIAGATALGTTLAVVGVTRATFDARHRLRAERIVPR